MASFITPGTLKEEPSIKNILIPMGSSKYDGSQQERVLGAAQVIGNFAAYITTKIPIKESSSYIDWTKRSLLSIVMLPILILGLLLAIIMSIITINKNNTLPKKPTTNEKPQQQASNSPKGKTKDQQQIDALLEQTQAMIDKNQAQLTKKDQYETTFRNLLNQEEQGDWNLILIQNQQALTILKTMPPIRQ